MAVAMTTAVEVAADTVTATTTAEIGETGVAMADAVTTTALHALTDTLLLVVMTDTAASVAAVEAATAVAMIVRHADLLQRVPATTLLHHAMLLASLHQPAATTASHAVTIENYHGKGRLRALSELITRR